MVLMALRERKKHTQTKPNETLRLMTIHWGLKTRNNRSVQETEQYLYCFFFLPLIRHLSALVHTCFTADRRLISALPPPISQMDHWHSLKAVSTNDWYYMTDRLQRFELKIFVCVLMKKQSHLHLGCPWGKQINIKFSFLGELSL